MAPRTNEQGGVDMTFPKRDFAPIDNPKKLVWTKQLSKSFFTSRGQLRALESVDLELYEGQTLGIVGESGCGKSTLGRMIMRLQDPTSGSVHFDGKDITKLSGAELKPIRRRMQIIFQDPYSSLNPRMTVQEIIEEALIIHQIIPKEQYRKRVKDLLDLVGLNPLFSDRYPHEFSGGQRQRVGIARALAVEPQFIVLDEPISALDVSVQAQIMNTLLDLKNQLKLTYLFIAHNLEMVRYISDQIAVMYLGNIVELASTDQLYKDPKHPYTQMLLGAAPVADPIEERKRPRQPLFGDLPSPLNICSGCPFAPRCPHTFDRCRSEKPKLTPHRDPRLAACHLLDR